jgi:rubrerythrin
MIEIIEVLNGVMNIKKKGYTSYKKSIVAVKNPHGKQTFTFLANEELSHYKSLEKLLLAIKKGNEFTVLSLPHHPEIKEKEIFETMKRMDVRGKVSTENIHLIDDAMMFEKNAIRVYNRYFSQLKEEKNQDIIKTLIEEEKKHIRWLKFMKEALEIHGYWYDLESYFLLGGL